MSNRLAGETSPYLLQHKDNPVDWYPWGEEAIERAKKDDKPILLSVGYSACHWCHVMAHECFENPEIASLMNQNFVNIKVDREERPDIDQIYQNVAQLITQGGGWPLTVFLTPDLKPFYGGTYFPPEDRYGRPGFPRVLESLAQVYKEKKADVVSQSNQLTRAIGSLESFRSEEESKPNWDTLLELGKKLFRRVDLVEGGFDGAPKFPNPMCFAFLWRLGVLKDVKEFRDASLITLRKVASGGIYDALGGGFHRYSVDSHWGIPHFEKMLYDNALLLKLYGEVILADQTEPFLNESDRELFLNVLQETVGYVDREMTAPHGGFYSAQDADSEGEEGKYFAWNQSDITKALNPDEARVFLLRYGVTPEGNFEHGGNILHLELSIDEIASRTGKSIDEIREILNSSRKKLFSIRQKRIAPERDEKILTGWNALMISGLVWASKALKDSQPFTMAKKAFGHLVEKASNGDRLFSTFQGGKGRFNAYLDDYAFMAMAALDLARSDADSSLDYIGMCSQWLDVILAHFKDSQGGGFFFTSDDHETLIHRPKTIYDQAIPSGTAVALECMKVIGGNFGQEVEEQIGKIYPLLQDNPYAFGELLSLSLLHLTGPITISGPGSSKACIHPHLFRIETQEKGPWLLCHRETCLPPFKSLDELKLAASEKLSF